MQVANLGLLLPVISGRPATSCRFAPLRCRKDNWVELIAINGLSHKLQSATGFINQKMGYESLVEVVETAYMNLHPIQQSLLVRELLHSLFPPQFTLLIKSVLPRSKFIRELFASVTTLFFPWLVGECEVGSREGEGGRERSLVVIKKCRFLQHSKCVGMCINLCKLPTQEFMKEKLGMPITMQPDFEDMSCRIVFGESPPSQDPILAHPCLKQCKSRQKKMHSC